MKLATGALGQCFSAVLCFLLLSDEFLLCQSIAPLRGVHPRKKSQYPTKGPFSCFNGSKIVDSSRVNDDVCDCSDGSDEPGTSACSGNGVFYCVNKGFKPKEISATFVDDGVCDCCDGSDEQAGCNNICAVLGQQALLDAQRRLEVYEAGSKARASLVNDASVQLREWKSSVHKYEDLVKTLKPIVDDLAVERDKAQAAQREAEEAQKPSAGSTAAEPEEPEEPLSAEYDESLMMDYGYGGYMTERDLKGAEDEADEPDALDPDAEAKRIASQWTSDSAASGTETVDATASEDAVSADSDEQAPTEPTDANSGKAPSMFEKIADTVKSFVGSSPSTEDDSHANLVHLTRLSKEAVEKHGAKRQELKDAEAELSKLKTFLQRDYGPENVYVHLQDMCHELKAGKYSYRVCGFSKALQIEGQSQISLGSFEKCENGCSSMLFTKGQNCWQGPARTMRVNFQCGPTTQLLTVEEPERCSYVATMTSPTECLDTSLQAVRDELQQFRGVPDDDTKDEL